MERSVIRDKLTPDYAALHPGYKSSFGEQEIEGEGLRRRRGRWRRRRSGARAFAGGRGHRPVIFLTQ
jgi:hypothetical protein